MSKKVLLIDKNELFLNDVQNRLMLEDDDELDIITKSDITSLSSDIAEYQPNLIVLQSDFLSSLERMDNTSIIRSYAKTMEGIQDSYNLGIPSFGIIKKPSSLIQAIKEDKTVNIIDDNARNISSKKDKQAPAVSPQYTEDALSNISGNSDIQETSPKRKVSAPTKSSSQFDEDDSLNIKNSSFRQTPSNTKLNDPENNHLIKEDSYNAKTGSAKSFDGERLRIQQREREEADKPTQEQINQMINRDLGRDNHRAKVITVYSAKGGVGKTTIATELAEQLALTYHGRGCYRVCIVDYNIDFGDVLLTLGNFSPKKQNMMAWAGDIKGRLEAGEKKEDINYTSDEIELFLQKDEQSGLYALIAPISHYDSMLVKGIELETMLRNLTENGNFDFVICDTGNNTRDSSYIALRQADSVLLVLTQDINTLNCNNSALKAIGKLSRYINLDKFKLVINQVVKSNKVNIPLESTITAIRKPAEYKGAPYYECIAVIPKDERVQQATNDGNPLVFNSKNHSAFNEAIRQIAAYEIGDTFELAAPKKEGFFKRLFKNI